MSIFPLCGVGQFISLMAILHAFLSVGSMWVILDALLSSVIVSSHVLRGLPRGFLPATGKFNILWSQWVSSVLATCPYHLSLLFLITCPILTRPIDCRRSSFLFLSHSDVLHIHLTILISVFSIRMPCLYSKWLFHVPHPSEFTIGYIFNFSWNSSKYCFW